MLELRGEDPRLASLDTLSGEEIPLHLLFRLHGYVIQVGGAASPVTPNNNNNNIAVTFNRMETQSIKEQRVVKTLVVGILSQVVFLYERSGNYLWHGTLRLKGNMDRSFAPFTLLDYGRHAGAYDR